MKQVKLYTVMILFALAGGFSFTLPPVSIYSFSVVTNTNQTINLANYRNKKMLLVNIATTGSYTSQLTELQQFYQRHKDSVLVLLFPSNSFNNSPQSNNGIKNFLNAKGITCPVVNKTDVKGQQAHALYKWIANSSSNGVAATSVGEDFEKILIGKNGKICGVFRVMVKPGDESLAKALKSN
jgi:glutathione peroxidase